MRRLPYLFAVATLVFGQISAERLVAQSPAAAPAAAQIHLSVLARHSNQKPVVPTVGELQLKLDGRQAALRTVESATAEPTELVLLMDSVNGGRDATQFGDIRTFLGALPPNVKASIAYMTSGQAVFAGLLTSDAKALTAQLQLRSAPAASAFFCLSDLAKHWPSKDAAAHRVVLLITSGVEPYNGSTYDPSNQYVQASIEDALRAALTVHTIFWGNASSSAGSATAYEVGGQSYLLDVATTTGGGAYGFGFGSAVSFKPYLDEILARLKSDYLLRFDLPAGLHPGHLRLSLKNTNKANNVTAPAGLYLPK